MKFNNIIFFLIIRIRYSQQKGKKEEWKKERNEDKKKNQIRIFL